MHLNWLAKIDLRVPGPLVVNVISNYCCTRVAYTVYSKNAQQIETEEIEINTRLFSHSFSIGCISTGGGGL